MILNWQLSRFLGKVEKYLYQLKREVRRDILRELKNHVLERAKDIGNGTIDKSSVKQAISEMGDPKQIAENFTEVEELEYTKEDGRILIINMAWSLYPTVFAALILIGGAIFRPNNMNDIFLIFFLIFSLAVGVISLSLYIGQVKVPANIPIMNSYALFFAWINGPMVLFWPIVTAIIFDNFIFNLYLSLILLISFITFIVYLISHLYGSNNLSKYTKFPVIMPIDLKSYMRQLKRALSKLDYSAKYSVIQEIEGYIKEKIKELKNLNEQEKANKIISELGTPTEAAARFVKLYTVPFTKKKTMVLGAAFIIASISLVLGLINIPRAIYSTTEPYITLTMIGVLASTALLTLTIALYLVATLQSLRPSKIKDYWHLTIALLIALLLMLPIAFSAAISKPDEQIMAEEIKFPNPVLLNVIEDKDENFNIFWHQYKFTYGHFSYEDYSYELEGTFFTKLNKNGNKLKEVKLRFLQDCAIDHSYYLNNSFYIFYSDNTESSGMARLTKGGDLISNVLLFDDLSMIRTGQISPVFPQPTSLYKYRVFVGIDNFNLAWITRNYLGNDSYEYILEYNTLSFEGELSTLWDIVLFTAYEPSQHDPIRLAGETSVDMNLEEAGIHILWSNDVISDNYTSVNLNYQFIDSIGVRRANINLYERNVSKFPVPKQDLGYCVHWNGDILNNTYINEFIMGHIANTAAPNAWIIWRSGITLNGTDISTYHFTFIDSLVNESKENILFTSTRILGPHSYKFVTIAFDVVQIDLNIYTVYSLYTENITYYTNGTSKVDIDCSATGLYFAKFNSEGTTMFNKKYLSSSEGANPLFTFSLKLFEHSNEKLSVLWLNSFEASTSDYFGMFSHSIHRSILSNTGELIVDEKINIDHRIDSMLWFAPGFNLDFSSVASIPPCISEKGDNFIIIGVGIRLEEQHEQSWMGPFWIKELLYAKLDFKSFSQEIKLISAYFEIPNENIKILTSIVLPVAVIVCFQVIYQKYKINKMLHAKPT